VLNKFSAFHILLIIYFVDEISDPTKLQLFHPSIPLIFTHNNITLPFCSYGSHDKQTGYILYHKAMNKKVTQPAKAMSKQKEGKRNAITIDNGFVIIYTSIHLKELFQRVPSCRSSRSCGSRCF
jgi:hypothetical protein